jgi:adenylate cyclase
MPGTKPMQEKRTSRRRSKLWYHTLVILGVGIIFTVFFLLVQPFSFVQLWLSDQLFMTEAPSPNIVVIGIDDDTLTTYGKWANWSRSLHAQALDNLAEAKAKVIGLDIIFADSSPDDPLLAAAMESAGNVVLPVAGTQPLPKIEGLVTYQDVLLPVTLLGEAARSTGHVNIIPDHDGKVRRLPLAVRDRNGQTYPSLSLAILHTLFSMPFPDEYVRQNGDLHLLAREIPVDSSYDLRINYSAEAAARPYLSYGDVIRGDFDPSVVRNKIVIIGMTATGELDTWEIPTSSEKSPGVFIQAAAMDTILLSRFLTEVGIIPHLLMMVILTVIVCLVLPHLKLKWGGLVMVVLFVAYLIFSFFAFDRGYILNLVYPPLLLVITFISSIITMILIEQSDKRFVKNLFGRYVSPQVADQILHLADAGSLQLGGEQREATILFADIRGFTKMSEGMSPKEIVDMLNAYLTIVIDRVLKNSGMVNKFAGDAIMAVWNAPQGQEGHARLAAKAAWEIQQEIAKLQEREPSLPRVEFGIGVNTGQVVAGNVGSSGRTEYTVIGDAVNLASRICSAAPGTQVWIGPETYRQIKEYTECAALEKQTFKGKAEPVAVYRLTGCK